MHLLAVGLNHKTAPLELREKLSCYPATLCVSLHESQQRPQNGNGNSVNTLADELLENVIVSTCNRLEYYALAHNPTTAADAIINLIGQAHQLSIDMLSSHLYQLQDEAVVNHLMQVAAGLDSLVLGEPQILGQLVEAHQIAQTHHATGAILSRLFEKAIHVGKRARTETGIGLNPASIGSLAVRLAQHHLGDLSNLKVLILGTGEMGSLSIKSLVHHGAKNLIIVNRTKQHADELAAQWNATALTFDQLEVGLRQADLVVASTAAPHIVLHQHEVARAMQSRPHHPLLIVDIALPRDVEASVGQLPGVHLYNLDDLQSQATDNLQARQNEIPKVEAIIAAEAAEFMRWYHSLEVVPTITNFREQFEIIRQQELNRALNRLDGLDEHQQKIVSELSRRLLNKFLHQPIVQLRAAAANGDGLKYTTTLQELFGLETNK